MNRLPGQCPITGGEIIVTRFYSPEADVSYEGRFTVDIPFAQLSPEQIQFIELFVRCEGKLSRMERELSLSYPTIRARLHEIIRDMGYEPGKEEAGRESRKGTRGGGSTQSERGLSAEKRQQVLEELDAGNLTFDEAMSILSEK